jgi:Spy/CpxP family protein refolding chaperone
MCVTAPTGAPSPTNLEVIVGAIIAVSTGLATWLARRPIGKRADENWQGAKDLLSAQRQQILDMSGESDRKDIRINDKDKQIETLQNEVDSLRRHRRLDDEQ